jgi:hypothetical protein
LLIGLGLRVRIGPGLTVGSFSCGGHRVGFKPRRRWK